jgi:hypothetical protein
MNEEKIIEKLLEHDDHFKKVDSSLEKITGMLLDHEDRLKSIEENMATKNDIRGIHDTLDVMVKLLQKRDEEGAMMSYRIQEHDKEITKVKKDIVQLKTVSSLV